MTSSDHAAPGRWTFALLGTSFTVEASGEALALLRKTLRGVADDSDEPGQVWVLDSDAPEAVIGLAGDLELHAASLSPYIAIHAGAVAVDGRAIVIPGRSLAGKSTLTQALVDQGAHYLSDEYALLDTEGRVHPYPRPMRLRREGTLREVLPQDVDQPEGGFAPALIAALQHDESGWRTSDLSPAQATLALIDNAVPAQPRAGETLTACAAAARRARALGGTRGEATDAAERLLAILRA